MEQGLTSFVCRELLKVRTMTRMDHCGVMKATPNYFQVFTLFGVLDEIIAK